MTGSTKRCVILLTAFLLGASGPANAGPCPSELTAKIPPRPPRAMTGSQFIDHVAGMETEEREAAIVAEILKGNIPGFLRKLAPVEVTGEGDGGRAPVVATLCVLPDYLAIGSDEDFVYMPMNLPSSIRIAGEFGFVLPTDRIVDAVHQQAAYQFSPQPLRPGPWMISPAYFRIHDTRIREQALKEGAPAGGALVAGHKKDVVLTNKLNQRRGRIAIYGWHYRDGTPIQPLSTAHHALYADYSHGIRLVAEYLTIDGRRYSIYDVLRDERLAGLLNGDGAIRNVDRLMGHTRT